MATSTIMRKNIQIKEQMNLLEKSLIKDGMLMTPERESIVKMDPVTLLQNLRDGLVSAVEALHAFQSKALEVTKTINCITEMIPEAQEWAEACDNTPIEERGPLHGFPISIKDNIAVQGMDSTLGLSKLLYNPLSEHAVVVQVLIKKGAVPFCKTNVPQTLLSFCCSNPVYGETKNPHDHTRTPGGSSGGEAALIASGGSVLGIGSDLAGSCRVPASFSGCVGFKPTVNRISLKGLRKALVGQPGDFGTVGVMGKNCEIVTKCLEALISGEDMCNLDPSVVPIPWNKVKIETKEKLVIGYFDNLHIFPSSPGVRRAIKIAKMALEKDGHELIPITLEDQYNIFTEMISCYINDGGEILKRHIKNEKIDPSIEKGLKIITTKNSLKPLVKFLLSLKSQLASEMIQTKYLKSHQLWDLMAKKEQRQRDLMAKMSRQNIQLILSPSYAIPAPQPFVPSIIFPACCYSVLFNFLNFTSVSLPVTLETEEDQGRLDAEYIVSDAMHGVAKKATIGAAGLPIGVLLSALPWQEELLCNAMMRLEQTINNL